MSESPKRRRGDESWFVFSRQVTLGNVLSILTYVGAFGLFLLSLSARVERIEDYLVNLSCRAEAIEEIHLPGTSTGPQHEIQKRCFLPPPRK